LIVSAEDILRYNRLADAYAIVQMDQVNRRQSVRDLLFPGEEPARVAAGTDEAAEADDGRFKSLFAA
jgi:hypothetical protein